MLTRRMFLKLGAGTLAAMVAGPTKFFTETAPIRAALLTAIPGGTLDPLGVPKYASPLVIPPAMPFTSKNGPFDYYEIAVRQFQQQILPAGMPATTVWSYGSANHPDTFNYPAFTIEANSGRPVRVKWINDLKAPNGNYLPHLLPVDPTLHWANPPGGEAGRDIRPAFDSTPGRYTGPVPIVTHVHGAHTFEESDGYPEAWFLPTETNIPSGYATVGTFYKQFKSKFANRHGVDWVPGSATFQYPNDQRATTLWYHDHTLGMTRLNVYAGPAGFYLLRGGKDDLPNQNLPGPFPKIGSDPFGRFREIPIAIQDRSFNSDGSLFYPDTRAFFDGITNYIPDTEFSPIWNPEFFGNAMVVNGRTWPYLEVEPRRYRFRLLNGCSSRFLMLKIVAASNVGASRPVTSALPFWQIGAEGGFLPKPVQLGRLLMAPAERADVIVDFSGFAGSELYLINEGPDEPFGGGEPGDDFDAADPATTGQVMKFVVSGKGGPDTSLKPQNINLPVITPIGAASVTRKLSLNEVPGETQDIEGPVEALLGTLGTDGNPVSMKWMDPITENPVPGSIEVWEIYNFTADAHPIHIHLVQFQVVNREGLEADSEGMAVPPARLVGNPRPPEAWETGFKDTVIAYPGEVTRVKAQFDLAGLYVWHCHIVEHEDNEMMRPYRVG